MAQNTTPNVDDFLFGGGGPKSLSFESIGDSYEGELVKKELQQKRDFDSGELLFFDDGNPKMQLVLTIKTGLRDPEIEDDEGLRRLFCSPQAKEAVRDAAKAAGYTNLPLGVGIKVTFVRKEPNARGKGAPKKIYKVELSDAVDTPKAETASESAGPEANPQLAALLKQAAANPELAKQLGLA